MEMSLGSSVVKVAVPSDAPGGLDARRSAHFGHCDFFTLVDVDDGTLRDAEIVGNPPHSGNCFAPIELLARYRAGAILVFGMGMRPLIGFRQSGVEVFLGTGNTVRECVEAFARGELSPFGDQHVCGGGGAGHAPSRGA
jgi:predicted Fe-Mo cluster-binding NifX family protein